jgi:hypothetical protein
MKTYGEWRYSFTILDLGTRWRWVISLTPGEITPGTNWIGDWVGPTAGLDAVEKRKPLPLPGLKPQPSSPYPSLYRQSYPDAVSI